MCNLYSLTRSQDAIRQLTEAMRDTTGNMPPLPGIFPDTLAPVVRTVRDGARELTMMRWGFPPPPNLGTRPVTNVRNVKSPYWRGWLKCEFRCLVPATSFCEWTDGRQADRSHSPTADKMNRLGIFTGADLRQSLAFLQQHFGKSGPWFHAIANGEDHRSIVPDRPRKSSGSETTSPTT